MSSFRPSWASSSRARAKEGSRVLGELLRPPFLLLRQGGVQLLQRLLQGRHFRALLTPETELHRCLLTIAGLPHSLSKTRQLAAQPGNAPDFNSDPARPLQ